MVVSRERLLCRVVHTVKVYIMLNVPSERLSGSRVTLCEVKLYAYYERVPKLGTVTLL